MRFSGLALKKKGVWLSWAISYVSVLLIPIIISTVVYAESNRIIRSEITQANQVLLRQVQQSIDRQMNDIVRLSLQIAWNPRLQALLYKTELTEYQHYTINLLLQDFNLYKVANSFIDDFFVYMDNTDIVLSPHSVYDMPFLTENIQNTDRITLEQWQVLKRDRHIRSFSLLDVKDTTGQFNKNIAYVQSLPWESTSEAKATLAIVLDESRFFESISNIGLIDSGNVLILDSNDELITSRDPISWSDQLMFSQLTEENQLYYETIMGERYIVSFVHSQNEDWKYVLLVPSQVFLEKLTQFRALIWVSIILCLLIGGVASYLFSRKHYIPIQNIMHTIADKAGIALDHGYDEYKFIEESITTTLTEKEKVQNILHKQDSILKSHLINQLLNGRAESIGIADELQKTFDMTFYSMNFAVALFYIEDYHELFPEPAQDSHWKQLRLVQFILMNVMEEVISKEHRAYMGLVEGAMVVCLINIGPDKPASATTMSQISEKITEAKIFLKEKFFLELTIALSDIHQETVGIVQAYQEALDAMEYRMTMGTGNIIEYRLIQKNRPVYDYTLTQEHQLINHIKSGDDKAAHEIINQVFSDNFEQKTTSVHMAKCIMSDLVSTMIKALAEVHNGSKDEFLEQLNPVEKVLNARTVVDMKHEIITILDKICSYISRNRQGQHERLIRDIIMFIQKNYMDDNLSVKLIGSHFKLTPSYLSKLFKEATGESLPDYIHSVRIDIAKKLLQVSGKNISQIAQDVGYNNSNSFIRTFKKHEGITPGQFKEFPEN